MVKKSKKSRTGELRQLESPSAIVPEVVEQDGLQPFEELTEDEERDRLCLERKVERAFYEAGTALKELRDKRLYRSTHHTFEEYCRERFAFGRRRPYLLIDAVAIVDNLSEKCDPMDHISGILPTNERQVRPLTKLEPEEQVEAWQQAVEANEGKVPPARLVKDAVQRIRERTRVPNPWHVGEVCTILVKENPELRGYGGCWAIVTEVHHFSCTVQMWDGLHQVRLENLKELSYSSEQQEFMRSLSQRLILLQGNELEGPVRDFLAGLGKLNRPFLTSLESKMLSLVEEHTAWDEKAVDATTEVVFSENGNLLSRADITH